MSSSATLAHISTSLEDVQEKKEEKRNIKKEENGIQENVVAGCCCNVGNCSLFLCC